MRVLHQPKEYSLEEVSVQTKEMGCEILWVTEGVMNLGRATHATHAPRPASGTGLGTFYVLVFEGPLALAHLSTAILRISFQRENTVLWTSSCFG